MKTFYNTIVLYHGYGEDLEMAEPEPGFEFGHWDREEE